MYYKSGRQVNTKYYCFTCQVFNLVTVMISATMFMAIPLATRCTKDPHPTTTSTIIFLSSLKALQTVLQTSLASDLGRGYKLCYKRLCFLVVLLGTTKKKKREKRKNHLVSVGSLSIQYNPKPLQKFQGKVLHLINSHNSSIFFYRRLKCL